MILPIRACRSFWLSLFVCSLFYGLPVVAQESGDYVRALQLKAIESKAADWGFWGDRPAKYSGWTNHSNRLVPVYTWGIGLESVQGEKSLYRDEARIEQLYGSVPKNTLNTNAEYFDQTDIYQLQKMAMEAGKKHVFLIVFDGMDWQTTQAAAIYNSQEIYSEGRGSGLHFLDYRAAESGYGMMVTSPHNGSTKYDVNAQAVTVPVENATGGYFVDLGGAVPWSKYPSLSYLISKQRDVKHSFTDSAASATSMNSGAKTYNASINIDRQGNQLRPIARDFQERGYSIGVVSSVPISHATPACAYANNVSRNDYQDLTCDLLGVKSASHRDDPLSGVDVLIGGGWGELKEDDRKKQGSNFVPGNKYLTDQVLEKIDIAHGGQYVVAQETVGESGRELLSAASRKAAETGQRLFGFFGTRGGHLPYRTADGRYDPTRGVSGIDLYDEADISQNPTLADMTRSALNVLETNERGFWLMLEAGDVDWANHNNNIDDSIGAVLSGDDAFRAVTEWVEKNSNWEDAAVILTADHGHLLVLTDPAVLLAPVVNKKSE